MLNVNKHGIKSMLNATENDFDHILARHLFLWKTGSRDMKVIDNAPSLTVSFGPCRLDTWTISWQTMAI